MVEVEVVEPPPEPPPPLFFFVVGGAAATMVDVPLVAGADVANNDCKRPFIPALLVFF